MNTQPIRSAKTLTRIAAGRNRLAQQIMDRTKPITAAFVKKVVSRSQFGWPGRRPLLPFDKKGNPRPTDMDLFSFLVRLYDRQAVLTLPSYKNKLPRVVYEEEQQLGTQRFGEVVGLIAHRELLSFSVQLRDHAVMYADPRTEEERLGSVRTFMMVDYEGKWHEGFKGLSWRFTEAESQFASRYELPANRCMPFRYYVHPHRRQSIFGAPYVLLKLLWMRLDDELAFYRQQLERMESSGLSAMDDIHGQRTVLSVAESTNSIVPKFRVDLYGLTLRGDYPEVPLTNSDRERVQQHITLLQYRLRPLVQFICRADELAFYHFGLTDDYTAPWVRDSRWSHVAERDRFRSNGSIALTSTMGLSYAIDHVSQRIAA